MSARTYPPAVHRAADTLVHHFHTSAPLAFSADAMEEIRGIVFDLFDAAVAEAVRAARED